MYMVSSFSENGVPGMTMLQENMVWSDSWEVAMLVLTITSYIRPRLTVVVVTSLEWDLTSMFLFIYIIYTELYPSVLSTSIQEICSHSLYKQIM